MKLEAEAVKRVPAEPKMDTLPSAEALFPQVA